MELGKIAPYFLAGVVLIVAALFLKGKRTGWALFCEKVPLLKEYVRTLMLARVSYLLSTLLDSGVTIRESIQITMDSIPEKRQELSLMLEAVSQGSGVNDSLKHVSFFGDHERALVLASEESGSLPDVLSEIAENASNELTAKVNSVLKVLEPTLILAIGVLVGLLVMAMILPITEIDTLVAH